MHFHLKNPRAKQPHTAASGSNLYARLCRQRCGAEFCNTSSFLTLAPMAKMELCDASYIGRMGEGIYGIFSQKLWKNFPTAARISNC